MNPRRPEEHWQRFAAVARQGGAATQPEPAFIPATPGFVMRVVERAMRARREFLALLWERWSWWFALTAATVAIGLGYFVMHRQNQPRLDIPSNSLEIPPLEAP